MARLSHTLLQSSIMKKNTKSKQSSMPDAKGEDVSYSTSCTGRATHTLMTHGSHQKTSMPPNSSQNSCIPTLPWLDDRKYKRPIALSTRHPHLPFGLLSPSRTTKISLLLSSVHLLPCLTPRHQSLSPRAALLQPPLPPPTPKMPR